MDLTEIRETLNTANEYMLNLQHLHDDLKNGQLQITSSSQETEKAVLNLFNGLQENLVNILIKRRDSLIEQTRAIKAKHLQPLADCQHVIQKRISETQGLIVLGQKLQNMNALKDYEEFSKQSELLGTLPEVPQLKDVPLITLEYEKSVDKELANICQNIGHISFIGPVQISAIIENPGSLIIQWQSAYDLEEKYDDIKEFQLQMAPGDVTKTNKANFKTCYIGTDTQHVLRDLPLNQVFTFRVCCKFDGSSEWSPWSHPQKGETKLGPYCWCENHDYQLTNCNKIAKPLRNKPNVLFARGPHLKEGYSIEFTFLDVDDGSHAFIGLLNGEIHDINSHNIFEKSSKFLLLQTSGDIYINSLKKSMKLPKITVGAKVCLSFESIGRDKIRINIDSQDKRVTYDWNAIDEIVLNDVHFIACFETTKWTLMVE